MRTSVSVRCVNVLLLLACFLVLSKPSTPAFAQNSAGAFVSPEAKAKDVGLPLYPGSKPHVDPDKSNDSPSAQLGFWAGNTGFQLVVLKMESADAPEKVAEYYRKALAKYGPVLDCTHPPAARREKNSSNALSCGDDKPDAGGMLFKAGTKERQHIVAVQPNGKGTLYQLVYLIAKGKGHEAEL